MSTEMYQLERSKSCGDLVKDLLRSASRLKATLKRMNTVKLDSVSDTSSPKWSRRLISCSQTLRTEKKEPQPQHRMENLVIAQSVVPKKLTYGHPSSMDDNSSSDDDSKPKETHHALCHYSSAQPKSVLTNLKPKIRQSLDKPSATEDNSSMQVHHAPRMPPVMEKESESPRTTKELVAQKRTNNQDISSSEDDNDKQLHSKRTTVEGKETESPRTKKKLVAQKKKSATVEGKETKSPRMKKKLVAQKRKNATVEGKETKSPRTKKKLVAQKRKNATVEEKETVSPCTKKEVAQKKKNDLCEDKDDGSFPEENTSSTEIVSQPKMVLASINGSPGQRRSLRPRLQPLPVYIEETDTPLKREKRPVRVVAQKKVDYHVPSSDDEDDENLLTPTNAFWKSASKKHSSAQYDSDISSKSDSSIQDDSDSSYESSRQKVSKKRRMNANKPTTAALKPRKSMSEYELKRLKNIEKKLAFLEALKKREVLST